MARRETLLESAKESHLDPTVDHWAYAPVTLVWIWGRRRLGVSAKSPGRWRDRPKQWR